MVVKASYKMLKLLNNYLKENKQKNNCIDYLIMCKFNENNYKFYVGDPWENEKDYNYINNTYNVIKVVYNADCYACDKYITTNDIVNIFKKLANKTLNELLSGVIDSVLI